MTDARLGPLRRILSRPYWILFLLVPFGVLFWTAPFVGDTTIGNDYILFSLPAQMELRFSMAHGSWPLYLPGFSGGAPASAATLGQLFHPISHLAANLPGYWHNEAMELNTFLRLLSLGFTQWVLFALLRRLGLNGPFAFLLSFFAVYNLRMLDCFRYGAALESYTAHLLLCAGIMWYYLSPTRWCGIAIAVSVYLLVCSGHPPMAYYGLLGAIVVTLATPAIVAALRPEGEGRSIRARKFYNSIFAFSLVGVVMASAYILPFVFEFLMTNGSRIQQTYSYSIRYEDTVFGSLNAIFDPFNSDVHGSFGGSALILLAALIPVLAILRTAVPKVVWFLYGVCGTVFLIMVGSSTPVHRIFWTVFPMASSMKVPGRISLVLPFLLMLLLAWLVTRPPLELKRKGGSLSIPPYAALALIAVPLFFLYRVLPWESIGEDGWRGVTGYYTPARMNGFPWWFGPFFPVTSALCLGPLAAYGFRRKRSVALGLVAVVLCCGQIGLVLRQGTWVRKKPLTPTLKAMEGQKKHRLHYVGDSVWGTASRDVDFHIRRTLQMYPGEPPPNEVIWASHRAMSFGFPERRLGWVPESGEIVKSIAQVYARMLPGLQPGRAFVGNLNYVPLKNAAQGESRAELFYSSFNRVVFDVVAPSGLFAFAFPYSPAWRAYVDGEEVPIFRLNGIEQGIEVPPDGCEVEFRYWSRATVVGMGISLAAGCGIFCWAVLGMPFKWVGRGLIPVAVGGAVLVYVAWFHSLYNGENLGTEYEWTPAWQQTDWTIRAVHAVDAALEAQEEGNMEEAEKLLKAAIAMAPYEDSHLHYGRLLLDQGRGEEGSRHLRRAAEFSFRSRYWAEYVLSLKQLGDRARVEEILADLAERAQRDPGDAWAQFALGTAEETLGQMNKTREHYEAAARLQPYNDTFSGALDALGE